MRSWIAAVPVALFFVFLSEPDAHAQAVVAADAEAAISAAPHAASTGIGIGGRLGYRIHVPLISLTPEIGLDYHAFGGDPEGTGMFRGFAGGRLAFGEIVKPTLFAHVGFGSANGNASEAGFTFDAGGALDFTALPVLDFGIHADYGSLALSQYESLDWIDVGAHVAIYF